MRWRTLTSSSISDAPYMIFVSKKDMLRQLVILVIGMIVIWLFLQVAGPPEMEIRTVKTVKTLHLRDHLPKSNYTFNGFVDENTLLLEDSFRGDRVSDSHTVNYTFKKGKEVVVLGAKGDYGEDVRMRVIDADVENNTLKIEYSHSKAVEPASK